ncbi:MAG: dihydropteroate synthase [Clostridiales bacterium]|nr:dihydropteroate synthase [Clostridiales bacterium]MDU3243157.1 dihydropteroate synthase [Clostridiales bacterium]
MRIGNREFDVDKHTYIMGILNVTPDSFSDGGKWNDEDAALKHAEEMIEEGADIIDIGGESTRPGYTLLSDEEEIARVVPVIQAVKSRIDVPVSIDTYKSHVARAALEAGADLVNDIWGLKYDQELAGVIAEYQVPCCLMHNRREADYQDFMKDMLQDLRETISIAKKASIPDQNIILDPGVGFGKTYENNLEAINRLEHMHELGYPILLGTSRKSVIGLTLDLPASERLEGTLATTVIGVMKKAAFVRVHDIRANARIIKMTEAITGRAGSGRNTWTK